MRNPSDIPKRAVDWVGQDDPKGCAIACAAMLAGVSYQEAKDHFRRTQHDAGEREIEICDLIEYLKSHGWEQCGYRTFPYNAETGRFEDVPTHPFEGAEATLCVVLPTTQTAHAVVVLPDGTVLDPARTHPTRLSDCPKIECLRAFRRIVTGPGEPVMADQEQFTDS